MINLKQLLLEVKNGDCYEVAGRVALSDYNNKLIIVHGMVDGQGPLSGLRFGHAWIEDGNMVIDKSNGNDMTIPKSIYYKAGNIKKEDNKYYTPDKARTFMLKTKHFGPWEMSGDPVGIQKEDIPNNKRDIGKRKEPIPTKILNQL